MNRKMLCVVTLPTVGLLLAVVPPAFAIGIRDARIKNGVVEIRGKDAQPNAQITPLMGNPLAPAPNVAASR